MSVSISPASEQMAEIQRLLATKEPLDPELELYLTKVSGYQMLRHPLVSVMIYTPHENAMLNRALRAKREYVLKALADKDWSRYLFMHERPHRFNAFTEIEKLAKDREYWVLLGGLWTDSENIWQHRAAWATRLAGRRRNQTLRPLMMERDERKALAKLPDLITVYRGGKARHKRNASTGMSWTLDKSKAKWFATRLLGELDHGLVYERTVHKHDVLAHFLGRGESEIVTLPSRDAKLVWNGE